jgi:hypothetical protein
MTAKDTPAPPEGGPISEAELDALLTWEPDDDFVHPHTVHLISRALQELKVRLSLAQGREDVIEECAKVVEHMPRTDARVGWEAFGIMVEQAAEAIRALKSLPSKEGGVKS